MRVGDLVIDTPVLLAPMAAVTDLPFRTVAEELGVGFTITEFLSAHALASGDKKTAGKMTASLGGRQFGVQIFGREPDKMQAAAQMAVSIGASLVDINMGGLPSNIRNFEVKHACYSGTAALGCALDWVRSGAARGKKALILAADF